MDAKERRAAANAAVKDAKRLLTMGKAMLDAGDSRLAFAYFEGAQGAAFDAKDLMTPQRTYGYEPGSNDPQPVPANLAPEPSL